MKKLIPPECTLVMAETKGGETAGMRAEDLPSADGRKRPG